MMFNKLVHPCVVIRLPADAWVGVIIDISAEVWSLVASAGVGIKVSGAVTLGVGVDINFALCPELLEEAMVFRRAAFRCRPMAAFDCDRVLQAWMPSYHV